MNDWRLSEAKKLRDRADRLEQQSKRNLPDKWEVGQKVRFIRTEEWAFTEGEEAYIIELRDEYKDRKADEYQVFYTWPDFSGKGGWWTTPDDVELIEDA